MTPFKICTKCKYSWESMHDLLADEFVCLVGFQGSFRQDQTGYFLFNHLRQDRICNTTFSVDIDDFAPLYRGPVFQEVRFAKQDCQAHCLQVDDLAACPAECRNAMARRAMQSFRHCKGR